MWNKKQKKATDDCTMTHKIEKFHQKQNIKEFHIDIHIDDI